MTQRKSGTILPQLTTPGQTTSKTTRDEPSKNGSNIESSGSQTKSLEEPKRLSLRERVARIDSAPAKTKAIIYGPPGCGKTVAACRTGHPEKTLLLDIEGGGESLLNHEDTKKVFVLPMPDPNDLEKWFWEANAGEWDDFDTVIIDNVTELQSKVMDNILRDEWEKKLRNPRINRDNAYVAQTQDYLYNTQYLRRLIINLRDLPKNLVIIAHALEEGDKDTGIKTIRPATTPKLAQTLQGALGVIAYMTLEVDRQGAQTRKLQVQPDKRVQAKTRIGGLPAIITGTEENPLSFEMFLRANAERVK